MSALTQPRLVVLIPVGTLFLTADLWERSGGDGPAGLEGCAAQGAPLAPRVRRRQAGHDRAQAKKLLPRESCGSRVGLRRALWARLVASDAGRL